MLYELKGLHLLNERFFHYKSVQSYKIAINIIIKQIFAEFFYASKFSGEVEN